jgi:hypothetical protein
MYFAMSFRSPLCRERAGAREIDIGLENFLRPSRAEPGPQYYGLTYLSVHRTKMLMPSVPLLIVVLGAAFALMSLGGGAYEYSVVDPSWPKRPDVIQPTRGGISRRRFWIPVHVAFEVTLITSLVVAWSAPGIRAALLVALVSHLVMRLWSAFDFIPKALAFERAEPSSIEPRAARRWARRSLGRLPLDLVTCTAMLAAVVGAARGPL